MEGESTPEDLGVGRIDFHPDEKSPAEKSAQKLEEERGGELHERTGYHLGRSGQSERQSPETGFKKVEYATFDLSQLFEENADLSQIKEYAQKAEEFAKEKEIEITGRAPVWLYMIAAHAMHGVCKELVFNDGRGNRVQIFDHHTEPVKRDEDIILAPKIKMERKPENKRGEETEIDVEEIYTKYGDAASLKELPQYLRDIKMQAGYGSNVTLTGRGPIWLYLLAQHELHGSINALKYDSPMTGEVGIYNRNK